MAMATIAQERPGRAPRPDLLSGTPRAHAIDRWIYVFMAVWFIAITLVGFVPDSFAKIAAVSAGTKPPFPLVMHVHAVLMGSFLLLLLAQAILVAGGRTDLHKRLGPVAMLLVPVLVVAGIVLAATNYHQAWNAAQSGPPALRTAMTARLPQLDNVLLLQIRSGLFFVLFIWLGLRARSRDAGFHKRMMFLATALPLGAALNRMAWLPSLAPGGAISQDLYILLAVAPLFVWDVFRNRTLHRAWQIWLPVFVVASVAVNLLWNTPGWHAAAHGIMGV
jgi:hypothetical protein